MDVLNNIWNLLSTENEFVTFITVLPLYFVETYLSLCIFTSVLKINLSRKKKLIYVILISIVFILSNILIGEPFNVIINYGIIFILLFFVYKLSFIKSILAIILPFAVFGIVNTLIMNPFLTLFDVTLEQTSAIPIYRFTYLCCVYLIVFLMLLIIKFKKIHSKINFDFEIDKSTNKIVLLNLILGIITLCMQALLTFYYVNIVPLGITIFNFVLLFSYFFLSFYSLIKTLKLHIATRDLENAESYNRSLTVLYDNVKGFKHDFDNMVDTIGGFIKVDDMEGLKKYYSDLRTDCVRVKNIQLLNPNTINNPGIYNLIVSEFKKALDDKVEFNVEPCFDFNNLHLPVYEFSRILGILLNNAIEAASECDIKIVNLSFRESSKNHVQIILVENTYKDKNIDTNKIFEKGYSDKENHSGIGLWKVKQIVNKNNNIVLRTTKDNKYFKQQLEIYY